MTQVLLHVAHWNDSTVVSFTLILSANYKLSDYDKMWAHLCPFSLDTSSFTCSSFEWLSSGVVYIDNISKLQIKWLWQYSSPPVPFSLRRKFFYMWAPWNDLFSFSLRRKFFYMWAPWNDSTVVSFTLIISANYKLSDYDNMGAHLCPFSLDASSFTCRSLEWLNSSVIYIDNISKLRIKWLWQ